VTDGERVIAFFGSAGLFCYDIEGKELWRRDLGKQAHIWGYGASPVLFQNLCILNFGPGERTFLIAVDKDTGRTVWQVDEPGGHFGDRKPGEEGNVWIGSWTTPIVVDAGERQELIMAFPGRVCALDPQTGREYWTCHGLNPLVYTSPLFSEGIVLIMGGFNGSTLAVKTGGMGDVTETRRLWRIPKTRQRIGSGVVHNGHVFILDEPGIAQCMELQTGKVIWDERLRGPGANGASWSSILLSGDKLYAMNQSGDTFILEASPQFRVLSTNSIGETTLASLAPAGGKLLVRTHTALWCIGDGGNAASQ
jgi:outer membrane protein assembly factor BamB